MTEVFHVIFESQNGDKSKRDGWLDYCREEPDASTHDEAHMWAANQSHALAKRLGVATRYRVERW